MIFKYLFVKKIFQNKNIKVENINLSKHDDNAIKECTSFGCFSRNC